MGKRISVLTCHEKDVSFNNRMQCPGNEKLFTNRFCAGFEDTDDAMAILLCLSGDKVYSIKDFAYNIKIELHKDYNRDINDTLAKHWLNNLVYFGLAEVFNGDKVRATNDGRFLINELTSDNCSEKECMRIFLSALTKIKARNFATKRMSDAVKSFTFRVLFYHILKEGFVTGEYIIYNFPYETSAFILENNPDLNTNMLLSGPFYAKWLDWAIPMLIDLGLLIVDYKKASEQKLNQKFVDRLQAIEEEEGYSDSTKNTYKTKLKVWYFSRLSVAPKWKEEIEHYFKDFVATDLFYTDDNYSAGFEAGRKNKANRNQDSIAFVKERDNYTCQITGNKESWRGDDGMPYCEGHHIVPMSYHSFYIENYGVDIDTPDYMMAVNISPHVQIHRACVEDKKIILKKTFDFLSEKAKKDIGLTWEKFCDMYNFKEDSQIKLPF